MNKSLLNFFVALLSMIFLASGVMKGMDIAGFASIIEPYGPGYSHILAPLISGGEILLGFAFIFFVNPKKTAFISLLVLLLLTAMFTYGVLFLNVEDCGCFGSLLTIPVYASFLRNTLMIILAYCILRFYPEHSLTKWKAIGLFLSVVFSLTSISISFLELKRFNRYASRYQGKSIYQTFLPQFIKTPRASKLMVFVFLPTCPHCRLAVPRVKEYKAAGFVQDIIGLYPSYAKASDVSEFIKSYKVDFPVKGIKVDSIQHLVTRYPSVFYIVSDTIVHNFIGSDPSPVDPN